MGPVRRVKHRTLPPASALEPWLVLDEGLEAPRTARMAQLAQRLGLDLPDTLACHREAPPDLLQRMVGALADPEAQAHHLLLARRERGEDLLRLLLEVVVHHHLARREHRQVLDEVAEVAVLLVADGRLEGDRL